MLGLRRVAQSASAVLRDVRSPVMKRADGGKKPCLRCGITMEPKPRADTVLSGVCRDCRSVDRVWIEAIKMGRRCA